MDRERQGLWRLNQFIWFSLAFVAIYLPVAQRQGLFTAPIWTAWVLFAAAVADGALRSVLAYRLGHTLTGAWSAFFNGLDIVLISASIGITGGVRSDLWLLYFVVLIFESLYAPPRTKYLLDVTIALLYLAVTLTARASAADPESLGVYVRLVGTRIFFLVLVTGLAWRISVEAQTRDRELMRLREQIAVGEERARIAREVHDSLGHSVVSTILRLELCVRLIRTAPDEAEEMLRGEVKAVRAAWDEGRDLAFHLRPWELDLADIPLTEALRRHISRFAERTGMVVELKVDAENWRLRPSATFALTRILQEALTNAARHARATHIEVTLTHGPGPITICTIADDGIGFGAETPEGVGLQAIRERAARLGGSLRVQSEPGKGTVVTVTLPDD
jgi:signal transduction histidine kinase